MLRLQIADCEDKRKAAHGLVAKVYYEAGYIPTPQVLRERPPYMICAYDMQMVGTVGVYGYNWYGGNVLPLDYFFSFSGANTIAEYLAVSEESLLEVSRLSSQYDPRNGRSSHGVIMKSLLYGVYHFMMKHNMSKGTMVASVKPWLYTKLREKKFPVELVPSNIREENIAPDYHDYFLPNDPADRPLVIKLRLNSASTHRFFARALSELAEQGGVQLFAKIPPVSPQDILFPWNESPPLLLTANAS